MLMQALELGAVLALALAGLSLWVRSFSLQQMSLYVEVKLLDCQHQLIKLQDAKWLLSTVELQSRAQSAPEMTGDDANNTSRPVVTDQPALTAASNSRLLKKIQQPCPSAAFLHATLLLLPTHLLHCHTTQPSCCCCWLIQPPFQC